MIRPGRKIKDFFLVGVFKEGNRQDREQQQRDANLPH